MFNWGRTRQAPSWKSDSIRTIQPIWRSLYAGGFVAVREKPRQTLGVSSGQFTSLTANPIEAFRSVPCLPGRSFIKSQLTFAAAVVPLFVLLPISVQLAAQD